MPRIRAALLTVLLLTACSNAADEARRPAAAVVVSRLDLPHATAAEPSEGTAIREARAGVGGDSSGAASTDANPMSAPDVERVAADAVIRLLEEEGLLVLDIATAADPTEGPRTRILTKVLYGTGHSHPRDASYLVELEKSTDSWTVVSVEAAP